MDISATSKSWAGILHRVLDCLLEVSDVVMSVTLELIFEAWEEEVVTGGEVRRVGWVHQLVNVGFSDECKGQHAGVAGCVIMVQQKWACLTSPEPPHTWSLMAQGFLQILQCLAVNIRVNSLTSWQKFSQDHTLHIKKCSQHCFALRALPHSLLWLLLP